MLNAYFLATTSPSLHLELAMAGLTNISLWLGWLQSSKLFNLKFCDITMLYPSDVFQADLPPGTGYMEYYLGLETKSNHTTRSCILKAYHTWAGLHLSHWFHYVHYHYYFGHD